MEHRYMNATLCGLCDARCVVRQVKTKENGNEGRWFISCPKSRGERGHHFDWVPVIPHF